MKKVIVLLLLIIFLSGCKDKKQEVIDYSKYLFTDIRWTRETEYDTEYINFRSDGSFNYSCACGNPVNDADLCDTYSYNDDTKEIKLNCSDVSKETITTIKVVNSTEDSLELDFNGDIRSFKIEK